MGISLSRETEKLIEEQMRQTGASTADDLVRMALQTLEQTRGVDYDDLDADTRASIDESEGEYQSGGGIPAREAFEILRKKHADSRKLQ
jgi:hypothetical protein